MHTTVYTAHVHNYGDVYGPQLLGVFASAEGAITAIVAEMADYEEYTLVRCDEAAKESHPIWQSDYHDPADLVFVLVDADGVVDTDWGGWVEAHPLGE